MSKSVLISIQPYWVFLIIAKAMGWDTIKEKTVEVRKGRPKAESWNKVAKIYCSKDKKSFAKIPKEYQPFMKQLLGKVIGEFVCDRLIWVLAHPEIFAGHPMYFTKAMEDACLTEKEVDEYSNGKDVYGWHISNLKIYDKPKELSEFRKPCDYDLGCKCCSMYFPGTMFAEPYCKNGKLEIIRPPQSWYYVEEKAFYDGTHELYQEWGQTSEQM